MLRSAFFRKQLFSLLSVTVLSAPATSWAQTAALDDPPVMLTPGDIVKINVWRHPELTGDFIVNSDGSLVHPLYRVLKVANTPLVQVESQVRQFLMQYDATPAFSIAPLLRVYVLGQVRSPNIATVPPGTTVAQVIAMAGGPTDDADLHDIRLIRGSATIPVDLSDPELPMSRLTMRSGDQVVVRKGFSFFRDRVVPASSVISALAGLAGIVVVLTRK